MTGTLLPGILIPALLALAADQAPTHHPPGQVADLIVINAKIWTVNKAQPEAQALAVWRDRIIAVGSDNAVKPLIGPLQIGPSDAAVIRPKLDSNKGVVLACGLARLSAI